MMKSIFRKNKIINKEYIWTVLAYGDEFDVECIEDLLRLPKLSTCIDGKLQFIQGYITASKGEKYWQFADFRGRFFKKCFFLYGVDYENVPINNMDMMENYKICVQRGLVGLPEPKETRSQNSTFDGLLSRLAAIREDDNTPVWSDRIYPFRCKIKYASYNFERALKLNDINDLRNTGKLWTWALQRASGANAMFSISNCEFETLLDEYMKINPFTLRKGIIREPYPFREYNLLDYVHEEKGNPQYEYSIMTLLNHEFARGLYMDIFGNYTDCII